MKQSILKDKSKAFAIKIVKMVDCLQESRREFVLSKQILRSGTSIGANIHEAFFGQSKSDFISKLSIALKETSETGYWLDLLGDCNKISLQEYLSISNDCDELGRLLCASIKTAKESLKRKNEGVYEPELIYQTNNYSPDMIIEEWNADHELNQEINI